MSSLAAAVPLHAAHETTIPLPTRLAVAAVAGLATTLVMTLAMRWQSYGYVPAYVAAGALSGRQPNAVSRRAAHAAHLAAGVTAGVAYEAVKLGYDRLRDSIGLTSEYGIAGVTSVAEVVAGVLLVCVIYGVFSWLVFPRYGGSAYETRPETVRRQWAVSAVVYGAVLVPVVGVLFEVLPL